MVADVEVMMVAVVDVEIVVVAIADVEAAAVAAGALKLVDAAVVVAVADVADLLANVPGGAVAVAYLSVDVPVGVAVVRIIGEKPVPLATWPKNDEDHLLTFAAVGRL